MHAETSFGVCLILVGLTLGEKFGVEFLFIGLVSLLGHVSLLEYKDKKKLICLMLKEITMYMTFYFLFCFFLN